MYLSGLGFIETLLPAATGLLKAGASGGTPAVNSSVSTSVVTQVSPQISPVFTQQSNPENSPVNAGASMTPNFPNFPVSTPYTGFMPGYDYTSGTMPGFPNATLPPNQGFSFDKRLLWIPAILIGGMLIFKKRGSIQSAYRSYRAK